MYQLMGIKFGPIRSGRDKNQSEVAEAHLAFFSSHDVGWRSWIFGYKKMLRFWSNIRGRKAENLLGALV